MGYKLLTDRVSIEDLKAMRESGMSTPQIAKAVGTDVKTIAKYIGREFSRSGFINLVI